MPTDSDSNSSWLSYLLLPRIISLTDLTDEMVQTACSGSQYFCQQLDECIAAASVEVDSQAEYEVQARHMLLNDQEVLAKVRAEIEDCLKGRNSTAVVFENALSRPRGLVVYTCWSSLVQTDMAVCFFAIDFSETEENEVEEVTFEISTYLMAEVEKARLALNLPCEKWQKHAAEILVMIPNPRQVESILLGALRVAGFRITTGARACLILGRRFLGSQEITHAGEEDPIDVLLKSASTPSLPRMVIKTPAVQATIETPVPTNTPPSGILTRPCIPKLSAQLNLASWSFSPPKRTSFWFRFALKACLVSALGLILGWIFACIT